MSDLSEDGGRHYALDGLGWTIHYPDRLAAAERFAQEWPDGPYEDDR